MLPALLLTAGLGTRLDPLTRLIAKAAVPLGRQATPIIRTEIRPFVRDFRPLVRDLKPASHNLADATPLRLGWTLEF